MGNGKTSLSLKSRLVMGSRALEQCWVVCERGDFQKRLGITFPSHEPAFEVVLIKKFGSDSKGPRMIIRHVKQFLTVHRE